MTDVTKLPDGITIDVNIYMTCDEGLNSVMSFKGISAIPPIEHIEGLKERALNSIPPGLGNFRIMTVEEVKEYLEEEKNNED